MSYKGENTRTAKRYTFRMPIECSYEIEDCDLGSNDPVRTFTTDISQGGLGIYSKCPAQEGQLIKIFLRHVFKEPIMAEVRWCKQHMDDLYKIGIRYVTPTPSAFRSQG